MTRESRLQKPRSQTAATAIALASFILILPACRHLAPTALPARAEATTPSGALQPSPNRLVGRVLAVDPVRGFAFVALTSEPPAAALAQGAELIARTDDLRETARLGASRYVRGRTLGAKIVSGQPSPGDEVVFRTP